MYAEMDYDKLHGVVTEHPLQTKATPKPSNKPKVVRGKMTLLKDEALERKRASKKASAKRIYEQKKLKGSGLGQILHNVKKAVHSGE